MLCYLCHVSQLEHIKRTCILSFFEKGYLFRYEKENLLREVETQLQSSFSTSHWLIDVSHRFITSSSVILDNFSLPFAPFYWKLIIQTKYCLISCFQRSRDSEFNLRIIKPRPNHSEYLSLK